MTVKCNEAVLLILEREDRSIAFFVGKSFLIVYKRKNFHFKVY